MDEKGTLTIRVDNKKKKVAGKIMNDLGLNLSTAVNMLLSQIIEEKGLPFTPKLSENNHLVEALTDIEKGRVSKYNNVDEMLADILDE
ncbi:addiction module antitoxin, RelB/DinJ family [Paucilactobacillus hokkaidonensis JCM 18461]|uniref:Addiction module antitoxin, RelB/DinJ family n=2 Tax=Paucilactobacillus hokkaidonensis TaxID=1193095 RepID=A0A0A1GWT8_9LACO|nr:type II toxin-antitoxin system RelB/DinJ family antitoxin [Paucilactobacillus hokkaidonensis]BAP85358.1 addiction module antitoxin, RelB/DinJ family [Paucilactobacillus hokkaidonensis JCM 18461]